MKPYAWILLQKLPHWRGLVSREIVEDDVDLLSRRAQRNDLLQKAYEVLTGVARGGLSMNTTGGGIQRRIQRERSVPVVFKSMAFGAAGGKRQNRIEPIQCLNRRLLINTEHGGMLRRIQIQSDNVGGFGLEVRIVAGHIPLQPMRLQPRFFPDAMHGILADAQLRGEFAATPVSGTILRLSAGGRQNPGSQLRVSTEGGCPGWLVSSPSSPEARKRCFHRMMVGAVVPSLCLIALNDAPSASIRISLARNTYPAGRDRDWAMRLSSSCCSSLRTNESMDILCLDVSRV